MSLPFLLSSFAPFATTSPAPTTVATALVISWREFRRKVAQPARGAGTGYTGIFQGGLSSKAKDAMTSAAINQGKLDADLSSLFDQLTDVLVTGETLEGHDLSPLLAAIRILLANDSLVSIYYRRVVYGSLFRFLSFASNPSNASDMLCCPMTPDTEATIVGSLESLATQSRTYLNLIKCTIPDPKEPSAIMSLFGRIKAFLTRILEYLGIWKSIDADLAAPDMVNVCHLIDATSSKVSAAVSSSGDLGLFNRPKSRIQSEADEYVARMRPLAFSSYPILSANCPHVFKSSMTTATVGSSQARLRRINSELSSLISSLPVHMSSSILVRCDEDRMDLLKVMITGPDDTPYSSGVFIFDMLLPPDYPNSPPRVKLVTTGGGRVMFNPNLYTTGKVCLSLLGTWSGPGWDPTHSTLLQVVVSIASLILIPNPYTNEPGHGTLTSPYHTHQNAQYNTQIRAATLGYAIYDQLKSPDPVFKDAILAHFTLRRSHMMRTLESWADRADEATDREKLDKWCIFGYEFKFSSKIPPGGMLMTKEMVSKYVVAVKQRLDGIGKKHE